MKTIFITCSLLVLIFPAFGQLQGISYQAMLTDESNNTEIPGVDIEGSTISNANITIRFSILNEPEQIIYQEQQATTTDAFGMVNVVIGTGETTGNSPGGFQDIDWDGTAKNLKVEVLLEDEGAEFIDFGTQSLYYVPYAAHRNITATGSLTIEGVSNFNNTLNVNNGSATNLSGSLDVDEATRLNSTLTVTETSDFNGQVTIDADVNGNDTQYGSYPLRVEGSNQGIAVRVDGGRNAGTNFLSFFDGGGTIHGNIEGQTLGELQRSFRFIWDVTMGGLQEAFVLAEGVACGFQLDAAEATVMGVQGLAAYAQWIELTANYELNVGVSFNSGGADYAEWLEKENPKEIYQPGEIVAIRGGKINKNTSGASQLMVISTNPIVVGNLPTEGKEAAFEKVAFLGQVPVRVVGEVAVGDYILPSENNDGLGVAQKPENMAIEDYSKIIGVAWQTSSNPALSYINMAIGLNSNDLVQVVNKQQEEIDALKKQMNEVLALLKNETLPNKKTVSNIAEPTVSDTTKNQSTLSGTIAKIQTQNSTALSDEEFEQWITTYGYIFTERFEALKSYFNDNEVDYSVYPELQTMIDQPLEALRDMRSGKYMQTLWKSFEAEYFDGK